MNKWKNSTVFVLLFGKAPLIGAPTQWVRSTNNVKKPQTCCDWHRYGLCLHRTWDFLYNSKSQNQMCEWTQEFLSFCCAKISTEAFLHDSHIWFRRFLYSLGCFGPWRAVAFVPLQFSFLQPNNWGHTTFHACSVPTPVLTSQSCSWACVSAKRERVKKSAQFHF